MKTDTMRTNTMKTENINLFVINLIVIGAVILAFALFGCSSGKSTDTTGSGTIDGAALYSSDCSGCHGSLATSGKKGASISQIQNAIAHNMGGMGAYTNLTTDQLQAIMTALSAAGTTNPATTNTTNASDTPTSSTASLDGAALYTDNCASCHGPLSASGKAGVMASAIQAAIANNKGGMSMYSNLTTAQLQAIADALAATPAPTPTPTPTLTDGASLYATYCSSCHGALTTSGKRGATSARILSGISSVNLHGIPLKPYDSSDPGHSNRVGIGARADSHACAHDK